MRTVENPYANGNPGPKYGMSTRSSQHQSEEKYVDTYYNQTTGEYPTSLVT